jgi:SpoVK/Ycf46/Vps4 family AAA+-type ATPase
VKILVIQGSTGCGKTALAFKLLEKCKKPVYIFKHPNPKLIEAIGYHNMKSESEFAKLRDCYVYLDEPQLYFKKQDKQNNDYFLLLGSMARQYGFSLIISTSDTRWVNKGLESYVSHWIIKDLDLSLVKQGSMIKSIIKNVMPLAVDDLNLELEEYIYYSKKDIFNNGLHKFIKPKYFDDRFSKAFALR